MVKLSLYFLRHFGHIFLFASRIKIEFMVVFRDAELASYTFVTKLAKTDDFLRQIVLRAFERTIHWKLQLIIIYPINQILNSLEVKLLVSSTLPSYTRES